MKKTLISILIFTAVLAAMLAIAALAEQAAPSAESVMEAAPFQEAAANEMSETGAAVIELLGDTVSVTGLGADAEGGTVTIAYPGTYRLSGALADGQVVVDCGDFHGAVYLILEGVDITNSAGPAIHIVQADETVVHTTQGTANSLRDGEEYVVQETVRQVSQEQRGAALYSADDLILEGEGALYVYGMSADGVRSKDGLTVNSGQLDVYAADDALQGSDYVVLAGGGLSLNAGGDGIASTDGYVAVTDGTVDIICFGDGISAAGEANISGGSVSVTAYAGAEHYEEMALADVSAKGIKGLNVTVSGGVVSLDTADDALHADGSLTVTGGEVDITSGDDALRAADVLTVAGGRVTVAGAYEAMEAALVRIEGGEMTATAQTKGIDAGTGGFVMAGGLVTLTAARPVTSDGGLDVTRGAIYLVATEAGTPLVFQRGGVTGGTVVCLAQGTEEEITEEGTLPGSFLYIFPLTLGEGTALSLTNDAGQEMLSYTAPAACTGLYIASGALGQGQAYSLAAGSYTLEGVLGEDCTVIQPQTDAEALFGFGPMGGASGGPSGGM